MRTQRPGAAVRPPRPRWYQTLGFRFAVLLTTALVAFDLLTEDKDTAVRRHAAMTIGQFGPKAEAAVPMLIQALGDKDARVVAESVTALGMIGSASRKAIPKLEKMLNHKDKQVRARATAVLKQIRGKREVRCK